METDEKELEDCTNKETKKATDHVLFLTFILWSIGYGITIGGILVQVDVPNGTGIAIAIASYVLWPFILGIMIFH